MGVSPSPPEGGVAVGKAGDAVLPPVLDPTEEGVGRDVCEPEREDDTLGEEEMVRVGRDVMVPPPPPPLPALPPPPLEGDAEREK